MKPSTARILSCLFELDGTITNTEQSAVFEILRNGPQKGKTILDADMLIDRIRELLQTTKKPQYMKRKEAAEYLRCSVRAIDAKSKAGLIPFHRISRHRVVFKVEDLDKYAEKRRIE